MSERQKELRRRRQRRKERLKERKRSGIEESRKAGKR